MLPILSDTVSLVRSHPIEDKEMKAEDAKALTETMYCWERDTGWSSQLGVGAVRQSYPYFYTVVTLSS